MHRTSEQIAKLSQPEVAGVCQRAFAVQMVQSVANNDSGFNMNCNENDELLTIGSTQKKPNVHFASLWTGCFSPAGTAHTHTDKSK